MEDTQTEQQAGADPKPWEAISPPELQKRMTGLFNHMGKELEDKPEIVVPEKYYRGGRETTDQTPPVESLQELLDILKQAEDWRYTGGKPYHATAWDPTTPELGTLKSFWAGQVYFDHPSDKTPLIRIHRFNPLSSMTTTVDLEVFYSGKGANQEGKEFPAFLFVRSWRNGVEARFRPEAPVETKSTSI